MSVTKSNCKELDSRGVKLGDSICIYPVFGRKKELPLNRIKLRFQTAKTDGIEIDKFTYSLPCVSSKNNWVDLSLEKLATGNDLEKSGRYIVKSNNPFKLNGSFVFSAVLEKGDELLLGYNKIIFNTQESSTIEELPLNDKACESMIPIILTGETGSGKTHLAKRIHERSGLAGRFIHINISSFSKGLIESELFGHVKGAFTGAHVDKTGALLEANGGTLFLDEIDSLPYEIQTKLLLFLDSGVVRPVGGAREYQSRVRLICASGQNLLELVKKEKMRRDFFFRISSGFQHTIKPLREDREKIRTFCLEFCTVNNVSLSEKLIRFYMKQKWPGNIRELKFHLEKKLAISKSSFLDFDMFDEILSNQKCELPLSDYGLMTMNEMKEHYIKNVFFQTNGKIRDCERILGVSDNTIRSFLRKSRLIGK